MSSRRANSGLRAAIIAAALGVAVPLGATAAQAAVTAQQISDFKTNPSSILPATTAQKPNPTPEQLTQLTRFIRDLVLADPTTLNTIISLLSTANAAEQAAIGRGLAQAALTAVQTNRALADQIQQAVAASGILAAINAYAESAGNVVIAATGGGGGGGGGGGPTTGGPPFGGGNGGGPGNGVGQQPGSQGFLMSGGASSGFHGQGSVSHH